MTKNHPITPPTELVQKWFYIWQGSDDDDVAFSDFVAVRASQYGADQELLACGNYLKQCAQWEEEDVTEFYNYRRPKPLSLKEQALAIIEQNETKSWATSSEDWAVIRRALEETSK